LHGFFAHLFRNTALPKNVPLFACELKFSVQLFSDNPFPPMLLAQQPFTKPMPITSARGINAPATYLRKFIIFMRVGEIGSGGTTTNLQPLFPSVSPHKFLFNFYLCNCCRDPKKND
jgi:hypothetical protein